MKKLYFSLLIIFVFQLNNFAQDYWTQMNGPFAGDITSIAVCPDGDIFATSPDGLFHSSDNGITWANKKSFYGIANQVVSDDSGYIYIIDEIDMSASYYYEYWFARSTDKGITWRSAGYNKNYSSPTEHQIKILNNYIYIGVNGTGIFSVTLNGDTLKNLNSTLLSKEITCIETNLIGYIFAGTPSGVLRSTNNGEAWVRLNNGLTNTDIRTIYVNPAGDIFVGTYGSGVFRSTNNGLFWEQINSNLTIPYISYISGNADGTIFAGTYENGVFRTTDNGSLWTQNNYGLTDNRINCIACPKNNIFLGAKGGGVFSSNNNGNFWRQIGVNSSSITALTADEKGNLFVAIQGAGISRSTDHGESWELINTGMTNSNPRVVAAGTHNTLFVDGGFQGRGLFRSTNNGNTWMFDSFFTDEIASITSDKDGILYLTTRNIGSKFTAYHSTDDGNSWQKLNLQMIDYYSILCHPNGYLFYHGNHGIYFSTDKGDTWNIVYTGIDINNLAVTPGRMLFYIYYNTFGFSVDLGHHWQIMTVPFGNDFIAPLIADANNNIFLNIKYSQDTAKIWINTDAGFNNLSISKFLINPKSGVLYAASNYGLLRSTVSISSADDNFYSSPASFILSQNYPNPFNPSTKINYSIPKASLVSLKVYDLLGREVATLVNEEKPEGNYEVEFDGSKLATGIYFYSIRTSNYYKIKKMILLK